MYGVWGEVRGYLAQWLNFVFLLRRLPGVLRIPARMVVYKKIRHPTTLTGQQLDALLALGWYRMNQTIFTTTHSFIDALSDFRPVWWLRFPVDGIQEHASHRRLRRRNAHFQVEYQASYLPHPSHELLYHRYLQSVPFDGYSSIHDALFYDAEHNIYDTYAILVKDGDKLVAMGIFDVGERAGTSILHFYDPAYAPFSLGKYLILLTLDHLRARDGVWYYPGYVVTDAPRFDYKLFLGKQAATYFDPLSQEWKPWNDSVFQSVSYSEEDWRTHFSDFFFI